jgi:hypothetical protein
MSYRLPYILAAACAACMLAAAIMAGSLASQAVAYHEPTPGDWAIQQGY